MLRYWGEIAIVPEKRLTILSGGERIEAAGELSTSPTHQAMRYIMSATSNHRAELPLLEIPAACALTAATFFRPHRRPT